MKRLHVQRVLGGQMQIPLSFIRVGDVIHWHEIVVGTANPQCWIRFRQISEGWVQFVLLVWIQLHRDAILLVPLRYQWLGILCHEHPFALGRTLASLWEDSGNAIPSVSFDVVPQPAVHKRSGIIFGHFCPQELFTLSYSCHVFGLEFVLDNGRIRFISTCPKCVLVVPLGKTQNGFGTDTGFGLGVGHGDTCHFNKKPKPGHRTLSGPRSRSTWWPHRRPPRTGVFRNRSHMRPPRTRIFWGFTHRRPPKKPRWYRWRQSFFYL